MTKVLFLFFYRSVPGTTHIVFGEAEGSELRHAIRLLDSDDRVFEFCDDLSFGPIAAIDLVARAQWIAEQLAEPQWREIVPEIEEFWTAVSSDAERHVVWFSRRTNSL